jgi:hypothetical protein
MSHSRDARRSWLYCELAGIANEITRAADAALSKHSKLPAQEPGSLEKF